MKHKYIKCIISMAFIILLLSGCSVVYINKQSIDEIIDTVLLKDNNLETKSLEGYSYYLPQGVSLRRNNKLNSILYYNHKKMYLYVDLISYYHKIKNKYNVNEDAYYSRKIHSKKSSGYLEITELENEYFVEFMYNYSKIEANVDKKDLNKTLTVMAYILSSIKFEDRIIASIIDEGTLNYNEEIFNIYKSGDSNNSDFLDILEKYDDGRINSKNEDTLEIEENFE